METTKVTTFVMNPENYKKLKYICHKEKRSIQAELEYLVDKRYTEITEKLLNK
jgi:hypothetical protein